MSNDKPSHLKRRAQESVMSNDKPNYLIRTGDLPDEQAIPLRHPLNENAKVSVHFLGQMAGLQRCALNLARVPPGRESFIYHCHSLQEEFVYILSGRGTAEIGEEKHEVGPGDFMGFPTDGTGHHLINTGEEDLVYLMGGERAAVEVARFPRDGKQLVFEGDKIAIYDIDGAQQLTLEAGFF